MKKLSELYGSNIIESLTDGVFCGLCNKEACKINILIKQLSDVLNVKAFGIVQEIVKQHIGKNINLIVLPQLT